MTAYVKLQQHEFAMEPDGYTAVKHQAEVGTGWYDLISQTVSQGLGLDARPGGEHRGRAVLATRLWDQVQGVATLVPGSTGRTRRR